MKLRSRVNMSNLNVKCVRDAMTTLKTSPGNSGLISIRSQPVEVQKNKKSMVQTPKQL